MQKKLSKCCRDSATHSNKFGSQKCTEKNKKLSTVNCQLSTKKGFSLIEVLVALSLMAFLAVYLVGKTTAVVSEDRFYKTCYMMEKIKEAIIGRPGLYCNGTPQFTGYVTDMGNLPNLCHTEIGEGGLTCHWVTSADSGRIEANGLAEALLEGHVPQPLVLWIKMEAVPDWDWKYHEDYQLWAGWKGPYIDPSPSDVLRDAWGNEFLFVIGEVVGHEGKTYRCKKTYPSTLDQLGRPGTAGGDEYWEKINEKEMNFRIWQDLGTAKNPDGTEVEYIRESLKTKQEIFYGDSCLTVISLGKNGRPGGEGLDKDISIVIEPTEYLGEVAGNAGMDREGNLPTHTRKVCLYFPNYTEFGWDIKELCINPIEDNSIELLYEDPENEGAVYTGIDFRFGKSKFVISNCSSWECEGTDGNCDCIEWEGGGDCIEWECHNPGATFNLPNDCRCTEWFVLDLICLTAVCGNDHSGGNWNCGCSEHEQGECESWECDHPLDDFYCECTKSVSVEDTPTNNEKTDIPIGIRSLIADDRACYIISVSPGGNWVGTVRSE